MANKTMSTFRLTPLAKSIIEILSEKMGVSQAAIVEMAVRRMAESERVDISVSREVQEAASR